MFVLLLHFGYLLGLVQMRLRMVRGVYLETALLYLGFGAFCEGLGFDVDGGSIHTDLYTWFSNEGPVWLWL